MLCPSDETLIASLQGTVADTGQDAGQIEQHVDQCARCATVLTTLAAAATPGAAAPVAAPGRGEIAPGARLGRFMIERMLGEGGMGAVYLAGDAQLGRKVAIKVLHPHRTHAAARLRMLREARTLARVSHPNVVVLHDVGSLGDQIFVAMELVDGITLAAWMQQAARSWREVVDLMLQAGRGLAAAHAAGIVHRDIKPHNLLVARDGRVRVVDFGLAVDSGASTGEQPADRLVDSAGHVTQTGAVLGTPAYMAPEQRRGESATALSDQYSFCVSLYEALCGERPPGFGAPSWRIAGDRAASPPPPAIRGVVSRGLAGDPRARYPGMDALLRDLERVVAPRRRGRWVIAAAVAAVAAAGGGALWGRGDRAADACAADAAIVAGVWGAERRAAVRDAFARTGAVYAASEWQTVERALDRYTTAWRSRRQAVCRRTPARGDAALACLDQRLENLRGAVNTLATTDATTVARSAAVAAGVDDLAMCDGAVATTEPLPQDPALRAQVQQLRGQLAARRARDELGDLRGGLAAHDALIARVKAVPYAPLAVEALFDKGSFQRRIEDRAGAEATLVAVTEASEALRYDRVTAAAWIELVYAYDGLHRPDDARRAERYARALLQPLGAEADRLRAQLDRFAAYVYTRAEKFDQALALARRALAAVEAQFGADAPQLADANSTVGYVLGTMGKPDEADRYFHAVLDVYVRTCGPDCHLVGRALFNLGASANNRGDYTAALDYYRRAGAIFEKVVGRDGLDFGKTTFNIAESLEGLHRMDESLASYRQAHANYLANLGARDGAVAIAAEKVGELELARGRAADALGSLEEALAIYEGAAPSVAPAPATVAHARFTLARALVAAHGDPARARVLARAARTGYAATGKDAPALAEVDRWLAGH